MPRRSQHPANPAPRPGRRDFLLGLGGTLIMLPACSPMGVLDGGADAWGDAGARADAGGNPDGGLGVADVGASDAGPPGDAGPSGVADESTSGSMARSASRFGITWTFASDALVGLYANGDPWVVGPVTIRSISPAPADGMNGFMINPALGMTQSFDRRIRNNTYVAPPALPLAVAPNSSVMSSISVAATFTDHTPQLDTIAILTVLSAPPALGSFRPPYIGTDKSHRWNTRQLRPGLLASIPRASITGAPTLEAAERVFERPWIETNTTWTGRYLHPISNQPGDGRAGYGREIAYAANRALLCLQLDDAPARKQRLVVRAAQCGIDIFGAARAGADWDANGGHNVGRKVVLLAAAGLLGDEQMLSYANGRGRLIFQEDHQTFYVTAADVGRPLILPPGDGGRPHVPYIAADVGLAEWGIRHSTQPNLDGRNWDAYYRNVASCTFIGAATVARLMGLSDAWGWPAFFDYTDRYWGIERGNVRDVPNMIQVFENAMYVAERARS